MKYSILLFASLAPIPRNPKMDALVLSLNLRAPFFFFSHR